jgi:opacity protein-like surface antigen
LKRKYKKLSSAASRKINQHGLGIGIGQTFLLGNYQPYGDNKITGDIFYNYTASYSFDFMVNVHASNHEYKNKEIYLRGLSFNIKGRSYEFDNFSPFFLGGLGFYQPVISKDGEESEAKNTFGFSVGAGADLRLNDKFAVGLMIYVSQPF